jgi:hypothetical protein
VIAPERAFKAGRNRIQLLLVEGDQLTPV